MAKMSFDMPDDFMKGLLDSDFEEIAREALNDAIPDLQSAVKRGASSVISDKTRTELVDSISVWKGGVVKTHTDAYMLGVSFNGKPKKGGKFKRSDRKKASTLTNNDIAWWLEHGNAHQVAKPFIDKSAKSVEQKIMSKMQSVYNKKVET